jgi:hypothetical protein
LVDRRLSVKHFRRISSVDPRDFISSLSQQEGTQACGSPRASRLDF